MSKPSLIEIDTKDDRREIWHLLHHLAPRMRAKFLKWCCDRVAADAKGHRPVVRVTREEIRDAMRTDDGDRRLTNSVYSLVLILGSQWRLDLVAAAVELESWVKRPGRVAAAGASSSVSRP